MTKSVLVLAGTLLVLSSAAAAQEPASQPVPGRSIASDSLFRHAIALVNDGEGNRGRALIDSALSASRPGSLEHAEALYWRATVATSAMEAEQDYRRIILDHPLSPRIPDALLRLAQLELARGDRDNAIRHLQRLDAEYPAFPGRARTSYWIARAYLDQNDLARGCAALLEARSRTAAGDVELSNQLDFLAQRCPVAAAPAAAAAPPPATPPAAPPATTAGEVSPAPPSDVRPSIPAEPAVSRPPPPAAAAGNWSVQVGAFSQRPQANALAERLRARGYEARVDGAAAPFRVRIGRYATRAEAASALREVQSRGMEGFVVQLETR